MHSHNNGESFQLLSSGRISSVTLGTRGFIVHNLVSHVHLELLRTSKLISSQCHVHGVPRRWLSVFYLGTGTVSII